MKSYSFEYCAYWVEVQPDGEAWIYEGASEFDYPNPIKICDLELVRKERSDE